MKTKLLYIATIQTGLFAKPVANGEVVYLQVKHFDEDGRLVQQLFPDLEAEAVSDRHLLKPGDVLFASKGSKNFAVVYESHHLPAVASTSFFVIRIHQTGVLPKYLAWYLNHPQTQHEIKGMATGTSMVSVSKTSLEELEIPVPDIRKQQLIILISELRQQEKKLLEKINCLKEQHIDFITLHAINQKI